jgi:hypothetical protein
VDQTVTGGRECRMPARLGVILCVGAVVLIASACGEGGPEAVGTHHHHRAKPSAPTTTSTTTTLPTVTTTSSAPSDTVAPQAGFRGIYEFAGGNSSSDARDPDLAGVVLVYYWSEIEPQKGVFDWSLIQGDMAPWIAAGKKVVLRISTSGVASWDPPYSGDGTPAWVFADGARAVSDNGETVPVYWNQAYLNDYSSFVQSFAQQFDGNPNIAFIEAGIGMGGETLAETNASASGIAAWESEGYTDSLWLSTVETIASYFKSSFHTTPIFPLVDMTFFDGNKVDYDTLVAWFTTIPNWGLQYDGLSSTQELDSEWSGHLVALEQRNPTATSGDCLCGDIANGLEHLHGSYLLIYKSDIEDPANAGYLNQAAAMAR